MLSKIKILVLFLSLLISTWAQSKNQNYNGYDSIVKELTASTRVPQTNYQDSFNMIKIHGNLGLVTSHNLITTAEGKHHSNFQGGLEASLGINLFSPHWVAKSTIRRLLSSQLEKDTHITLNEFNLQLLYHSPISHWLKFSLGLGLAARYLELNLNKVGGAVKQKFSTPASILSLGLEVSITQSLSMGTELAYRSALTTDAIDNEAFDATLHLGVHL